VIEKGTLYSLSLVCLVLEFTRKRAGRVNSMHDRGQIGKEEVNEFGGGMAKGGQKSALSRGGKSSRGCICPILVFGFVCGFGRPPSLVIAYPSSEHMFKSTPSWYFQ
jgi:hypothetical protein